MLRIPYVPQYMPFHPYPHLCPVSLYKFRLLAVHLSRIHQTPRLDFRIAPLGHLVLVVVPPPRETVPHHRLLLVVYHVVVRVAVVDEIELLLHAALFALEDFEVCLPVERGRRKRALLSGARLDIREWIVPILPVTSMNGINLLFQLQLSVLQHLFLVDLVRERLVIYRYFAILVALRARLVKSSRCSL